MSLNKQTQKFNVMGTFSNFREGSLFAESCLAAGTWHEAGAAIGLSLKGLKYQSLSLLFLLAKETWLGCSIKSFHQNSTSTLHKHIHVISERKRETLKFGGKCKTQRSLYAGDKSIPRRWGGLVPGILLPRLQTPGSGGQGSVSQCCCFHPQ